MVCETGDTSQTPPPPMEQQQQPQETKVSLLPTFMRQEMLGKIFKARLTTPIKTSPDGRHPLGNPRQTPPIWAAAVGGRRAATHGTYRPGNTPGASVGGEPNCETDGHVASGKRTATAGAVI